MPSELNRLKENRFDWQYYWENAPAASDSDIMMISFLSYGNNPFSFTTERTQLVEPPKMLMTFFLHSYYTTDTKCKPLHLCLYNDFSIIVLG